MGEFKRIDVKPGHRLVLNVFDEKMEKLTGEYEVEVKEDGLKVKKIPSHRDL